MIRTRALAVGCEIVVEAPESLSRMAPLDLAAFAGVLLQYPDTYGVLSGYSAEVSCLTHVCAMHAEKIVYKLVDVVLYIY